MTDRNVLFVNGFHRSGTTLVTSAATAATGGVTVTVGHLARHLPTLDRLVHRSGTGVTDRGVDRLAVTASTPEEYGWMLRHATGHSSFRGRDARSGILDELVDDLARESASGVVVLKNPWDTGRERLLLAHFAGARVLLVRRQLAAVEESAERALRRYVTSNEYLRALTGDDDTVPTLLGMLAKPWSRAIMMFVVRWRLRVQALKLARSVSKLPLERVAFLSYEELRRDPYAGAGWASHVLDPLDFGGAIEVLALPEEGEVRPAGWVVKAIDRYWARAWRRARDAQVEAGVLAHQRTAPGT